MGTYPDATGAYRLAYYEYWDYKILSGSTFGIGIPGYIREIMQYNIILNMPENLLYIQ